MSNDDKDYKVVKNGLKSLFLAAKGVLTNEDQYVSKEIQKERQRICNGCSKRNVTLNQCGVCLCLLNLKTRLKRESCPEGKWKAEDTKDIE